MRGEAVSIRWSRRSSRQSRRHSSINGKRCGDAISLALLEVAFGLRHAVSYVGKADHRLSGCRREGIKRGYLHVNGEHTVGACCFDGSVRL